MNKAEVKRQEEIKNLSTQVVERAHKNKGGSAALVPAPEVPHGKVVKIGTQNYYTVSVDEYYHPVACTCQGGAHFCKHKQAVVLYFVPILEALLDEDANPRFSFYRGVTFVVARLSQFSRSEKAAYKEHKVSQERAAYNVLFDPNYNNVAA